MLKRAVPKFLSTTIKRYQFSNPLFSNKSKKSLFVSEILFFWLITLGDNPKEPLKGMTIISSFCGEVYMYLGMTCSEKQKSSAHN